MNFLLVLLNQKNKEGAFMIPEGAIISGFISKIINDITDISIDKLQKADKDRKSKNQSFETRI